MRERAVIQKVGNGSGIASTRRPSTAQKPAEEDAGREAKGLRNSCKSFTGYLRGYFKGWRCLRGGCAYLI